MKRIYAAALLILIALVAGPAGADELRAGTISGQLKIDGNTPMSDGMVYVYNLATGPAPSRDRYWRVPDFVEKLDKDGRFSVELPPGEFCIGAIKRVGAPQIGPPLEGDYFVIGLDEKNNPRRYQVSKGDKQDIGIISGAIPYKRLPPKDGITGVEGTVLDQEGKPVEGAMVFAFITSTIVGKPLFVSDRSGKDGTFLLRVHEGGSYYLKVRDNYGGGPPRGGSVLDGNKEEPMVKVAPKTGEVVKGIMLKGKKFPGRGPNKE